MKRLIFALVLVMVAATLAICQPRTLPKGDSYAMIAGEHTPVIYSGSGLIKGSAGSLTTSWLQIGYSPSASETANGNLGRYNPEKFTVGIKLANYGVGDSARLTTGRFDLAYDTSAAPFWNGDSSNRFIKSGNFSLGDYGVWRFEGASDTSRQWLYPLKVMQGGYIRFVFETTTADTTSLSWILTGEH